MDETPEKYLISMAKQRVGSDKYKSKAWLLTATTLFRNNFAIQFEAYEIEKEADNCKEAAKCFKNLFEQFKTNERLWVEIQLVLAALRTDHPDENQRFLNNMFNHLPPEVQHQLLLVTAEQSEDTMDHCHLMLLLMTKFPDTISQHGARLVDLLVSAEKHDHGQAVNCYRKLLVCDLIPLLGATTSVDLPNKQLFKLLHKSIEFYLCYVMNRSKIIQDLSVKEEVIDDPWGNLFLVIELVGHKLHWELCDIFKLPLNKELVWQKIVQFRRTLFVEQQKHGEQLLYSTVLLFLYCLYDYSKALDSMVLVEAIVEDEYTEQHAKKRKLTAEDLVNIHWTVGDSTQSAVTSNFMLAYQCWNLLYSSDYLDREFTKLIQTLGFESWISEFIIDVRLYQDSHEEAVRLLSVKEPTRKTHVRRVSAYYFLGQYTMMLENVVGALSCWHLHTAPGALAPTPSGVSKERHLHYLPMRRNLVLQYCSRLLIAALKRNMVLVTAECDQAMGHILVLMQLDWPQHEDLQMEVMQRIRQRGSFTYALFMKYIVLPDIVNDFMLLFTENVLLDILPPNSNQMLNHRRISTRGVDKGAREDFKIAMKRQVARSAEPIDSIVIAFLKDQRDFISHSLSMTQL